MESCTTFCQQNGLPPSVAAAWRARGITGWTPLQQAAWHEGVHCESGHWLLAGPTSAGKGLAAEVAVVCALLQGRKALWLAPTRALAAMVSQQFEKTLAGLGLRVLCATRDTPAEDAPLFRNQFDLLVAVYEKAAAWVTRQPHALAEVGLVVTDELAMLRDPERGGRLDVLLTLLASSPYAPRRLGLTLPVANLDCLARWWGGRLLTAAMRPRALHEGVLDFTTGRLRWRDRASGEEAEAELQPPRVLEACLARTRQALDEADWPPLRSATAAVAGVLAARGEPTLLFASSRALARAWAGALAEALDLPPAAGPTLARARRLALREPSWDHQLLARVLEHGVGLHHADLSAEARRLVEEAFGADQVRLLVATPTLAQGVNLAAANVVHWAERPEAAGAAGWRRGALERWRFADQGGRAGRFGMGQGAGRSILVAWEPRQAAVLWQRYLEEPAEPVEPALAAGGELAPALLACLAGDVARSRRNLGDFFMGTFAGQAVWRRQPHLLEDALATAIAQCRAAELIREARLEGAPGEPRLRLTGLGQVCAAQGLDPALARRLAPCLDPDCGIDPAASEPLPALCLLALAAPAGVWPAGARPGRSPIVGELRRWFEENGCGLNHHPESPNRNAEIASADVPNPQSAINDAAIPAPLAAVLDQAGGPAAEELAALEAAWRLGRWIGPEPTGLVERRTGWPAGSLARAGEALAWVAGGAAALTLARGGRPEAAEAWRALAARLGSGATRAGAGLAALRVEGLGRSAILALCAAGLTTPQALAGAPPDLLLHCLGGDGALARLVCAAAKKSLNQSGRPRRPRGDCGMDECGLNSNPENSNLKTAIAPIDAPHPQSAIDLVEIDLQSPGVVKVGGREVRLTPLAFDLLTALAETPGKVLTRSAIYQRLWPEGGPEDQQLDAHRRRLTSQLNDVLGREAGQVVEVVRGQGFRLNLPRTRVHLLRG